jgi:hypothetical protein
MSGVGLMTDGQLNQLAHTLAYKSANSVIESMSVNVSEEAGAAGWWQLPSNLSSIEDDVRLSRCARIARSSPGPRRLGFRSRRIGGHAMKEKYSWKWPLGFVCFLLLLATCVWGFVRGLDAEDKRIQQHEHEWLAFSIAHKCKLTTPASFTHPRDLWTCEGGFEVER